MSDVDGVRGFTFACSLADWEASYRVLVQVSNIEWR